MSNKPGFNEHFHEYYDQFSIPVSSLNIPSHFAKYIPDNQDDYNCTLVISPSPKKGAKKWTQKGKIITIGIYRDEGRESELPPIVTGVTWDRTGTRLLLTCVKPHGLAVKDHVHLWNINVSGMFSTEVTEIVNSYKFAIKTYLQGASSGVGAYQSQTITNFYESYRVFRLLPSFKLLTISELNSIFSETAPLQLTSRRTLFNITTNKDSVLSSSKTSSTNYDLPTAGTITKDSLLKLKKRFNQQYDEAGVPLSLSYQETGYASPVNNVDSKYKNQQIFYNAQTSSSRIKVYDFYGLDLNDEERGPYFSTTNVTRDEAIKQDIGNLEVKTDNQGNPIYSGQLYDEFGNLAIGVQSNNALVVRKQILPLILDAFNMPTKSPIN
jgi:hypothetical protein